MPNIDLRPPTSRGSLVLDRDAFRKSIPLIAARIKAPDTGAFKKAEEMKSHILDLPNIKSVEPDPQDPKGRLVLLSAGKLDELPSAVRDYVKAHTLGFTTYELELNYDYWNAGEILHALLPEELCKDGVPTAFTHMGHIGHFNLREEFLPYKHVIGQVILDKNKKLRTIVNKLDTIETQFRTFKMEVIAGQDDFNVVVSESDCTFAFDFSKVYWNSRLQAEHKRLIDMISQGEVVADVFAGVGPFAVPLAKKGCFVYGNDLNPDSASFMEENSRRNKVVHRLRVYCEDGRSFINHAVLDAWNDPVPYSDPPSSVKQAEKARRHGLPKQPTRPPRRRVDHFVMNLPATAIEFLGAFRGCLKRIKESDPASFDEVYGDRMPMVHCHAFSSGGDPEVDRPSLIQHAEQYLGCPLEGDVSIHLVRDVAPNKRMYCLSFRLPKQVAFA